MEKISEESAAAYIKLGDYWDLHGQPQQAEQAFLKALRITDEILFSSKDIQHTSLAKEICLRLADLNMQQGNMHGADFYYVKAMNHSQSKI